MFHSRNARFALFTACIALASLLNMKSTLALESGLHGRVLGHNENGEFVGVVAGAKISFEHGSGQQAAETVADQNGYYKIELPPGEYNYKLVASGYRTEKSGRGLRLAQDVGFAIANLSLTKGVDDPNQATSPQSRKAFGRLRGRVVERSQNGLIGVYGARIALRREGSASLRFIDTDSRNTESRSGQFASELETGKYSVSVFADGFEVLREDMPIEIVADQETQRDFTLIRKPVESSNDEGIRGSVSIVDSGLKHPPIQLTLQSISSDDHTTLELPIANNGAFSQLLAPGCYRVTAAEGFPTVSSAPTFVLPGRFTLVNLTLRSRSVPESKTTLEVYVFEKKEGRANDLPLPGVRVTAIRAAANDQTAIEAITDGTGHARLALAHGGTYTATAFLNGYKVGSGTGKVDLGHSHEVGIELVKENSTASFAATIQVSVIDAVTKMPLSNAKLLARQPTETLAESVRATTDASGAATLNVRKSGKYAILAQHTGFLPKGDSIEVGPSGTHHIAFELESILPSQVEPPTLTETPTDRLINIHGYVAYREATGQLRSVPGTKIIWQRSLPSTPPISSFTVTGSDGKYQVNLQRGTYQARVQPPAGFQALLEEVQVNDELSEKYFILERSEQGTSANESLLSLKGHVVTESSLGRFMPVASADVQVFQSAAVERAITNARGEFGFRLPAGTYRVHVQARGYEPAEMTANLSGNMAPMTVLLKRTTLTADSNLTLTVVQPNVAAVGSVTAVVGANVRVLSAGQEVASGFTNRGGQFSTHLKPGLYVVSVTKAGFNLVAKNITVAQANILEQIALSPVGSPSNTIHQATLTVHISQRPIRPSTNIQTLGVPLVGAQVIVMQGARQVASGATNSAGICVLTLQPGFYSVKAEAPGFVLAEKTVQVAGTSVRLDFLLNHVNSGFRNDQFPDLNFDPNRPSSNLDRNKLPILPLDPFRARVGSTYYVAEYRLNALSPWVVIASKPTQQEANAALFLSIEHGRVPRTAQTRIRIESSIAR